MRAHLKSMFQICASLRPGWIQVSRKVRQGLVVLDVTLLKEIQKGQMGQCHLHLLGPPG